MGVTKWLLLVFCLIGLGTARGWADGAGPTGVWLGQDGHDSVGPSSVLGPSDVQDLHIRLTGLPVGKEIASLSVTREGGGQWLFNGPWGPWKADLQRASAASTVADLYLEPSHTDNPSLHVLLKYADGTASEFDVRGGHADVNLRMPNAAVAAQWVGQDGPDWTGPGPAVGPDGQQDAHIALSHLSAHIPLKSLTVIGPGNARWQYGLNPERDDNAELASHPDDPSQADLYFSPTQDLQGQALTLKMVYANDKADQTQVTAGACDPARGVPPPPMFVLQPNAITARWLGQDGRDITGRGDIHVALAGLPAGRTVIGATLSDPCGGLWQWQATGTPSGDALPLAFVPSPAHPTADLYFPPYRDEAGDMLTLRLTLDDGATTLVSVQGRQCDPFRRGPLPEPTKVIARPGDDLQDFARRFGTMILSPGTYSLDHPLSLDATITIRGRPGVVLRFTQPPDSPPWSEAITIRRSNTTLAGFAVRFAGPIRWTSEGNPAVLGTAGAGAGTQDPRVNLVVSHLDLEGPPVPGPHDPAKLAPSPFLMRLGDATSGQIVGNVLRGGTTDVTGGPWHITDNVYRGAVPGTMAWDTFGGHYLHDLVVARNQLAPLPGSGKTWRFLVLTQWGMRDRVTDNAVRGVGIRDGDGVPNPNAPEMFLTEAYRLHYEGTAHWLSSGGRVLQIPQVMDGTVRPGTVVALLTGPHAGQWFRVAQALTPTTYLMETPLPPGDYALSIATGFVEETYARNTIDNRGGSSALMDLAGTHFGTRILNNHLLGGGDGMVMLAMPTERPNLWGWSHVPFFGVTVSGNTVEDSRGGLLLDASDNEYNKATARRVYVQAAVQNNTVRWTGPFLHHWRQTGAKAQPLAFRLGDRTRLDADEFVLAVEGNAVQAPPGVQIGPALFVKAATVNGRKQQDQRLPLPVRHL